ncbi:MAG: hypothetical protein LH609_09720 [Rudanella sp.]|nr:hypothetical protein [Rudanella sp.]
MSAKTPGKPAWWLVAAQPVFRLLRALKKTTAVFVLAHEAVKALFFWRSFALIRLITQ